VNLVLLAAVGFLWFRLNRPVKDDPRLSRGLQLLQSKISVLEDLSDRTETQVTQLTALMEQKCRDIQALVIQADKQIQKIDASMGKSLEVAKIFQDKIPHQEIIERQNTIKYVKAARMAHQGASIDQIATEVDLSRGEIEFIAKVNREQLQFSEDDLPAWAQEENLQEKPQTAEDVFVSFVPASAPRANQAEKTLSDLGAQFRQAIVPPTVSVTTPSRVSVTEQTATQTAVSASTVQIPQNMIETPVVRKPAQSANASNLERSLDGVVRKVVFPKIGMNNNLG
jgi:hypothetical protein